jgi:hypothetical protein
MVEDAAYTIELASKQDGLPKTFRVGVWPAKAVV